MKIQRFEGIMEKIIKITFPDDFEFGNVGSENCEKCPICKMGYENNVYCGLPRYDFNRECPLVNENNFNVYVKEIVRCEKCKHFRRGFMTKHSCDLRLTDVDENDYCNYASKKG